MKFAVKASKLNCPIAVKKAMQVQKVVPAIMVMGASAFAVTFVPDALNRRHGFGLTPIHLLNQCRIHLFTKPHPVRLNLQCFIEKVILAGDNVDKITDASRCVVCTVYMDMNSTTCVCKTSSLAKPPYQFLQGFNVFAVCQYRAYQLDAIFPASRHNPAVFLFLSPDAPVAHEFPYPSIRCNNLLGIVIISAGFNPPSKKSCCSFCRLFSCHPRQFYLDSKSRCKHSAFSSLSLCFLPFGSVH